MTTVIWLEFFPQYWIVSTLISYLEVTWHLTIIPYPAKNFWAGMRRSKIYGGKIVYEPHLELFKNITNFRGGLLGHVPVSIQNSKFWKLIRKQEAFANEGKKLLAKVPQYMGSSDRCCDCQWFKLSRGLEPYSICAALVTRHLSGACSSSLESHSPVILSEFQYLLCSPITLMIVSKQLQNKATNEKWNLLWHSWHYNI